MLDLIIPTSGDVSLQRRPIKDQRSHWREVQPVFQDPFSCFNQFFTIRSQLKKLPSAYSRKSPRKKKWKSALTRPWLAVNIKPPEIEDKYPFELSGGQMQRMLLARIFILRPRCSSPTNQRAWLTLASGRTSSIT